MNTLPILYNGTDKNNFLIPFEDNFFSNRLSRMFNSLLDVDKSMPSAMMGIRKLEPKDGKKRWTCNVTGLSKDDLEIWTENGYLNVKGETPEDAEMRNYVEYRMLLPKDIDEDTLQAKVKNGMLFLSAKSDETEKRNTIKIE